MESREEMEGDGSLPLKETGEDEYLFRSMTSVTTKEKLTWMVNNIIEELMDFYMWPNRSGFGG